jgi:AAA+ superfamily predicted ATPase
VTDTDLPALIASRHNVIFAIARDEDRLIGTAAGAASGAHLPFWRWSAASGLVGPAGAQQTNTRLPEQALGFLNDLRSGFVAVLLDAGPWLTEPVAARTLKEVAGQAGRTVILTGAGSRVPPDFAGLGVTWTQAAPTRDQMRDVVVRTLNSVQHLRIDLPDAEPIVDALLGLTPAQAERAILREVLADGRLDGEDAARLHKIRAQLLSSEAPLDLLDTDVTMQDVGGVEHLKQWLAVRRRGLEPAARDFGLEAPRGVLLVGVPGCGKSLIAKAVASSWGLPLIALDTARLHGSYVGESEQRMQRALDAAEAMAPVVLWIDEVEKAFGGREDRDGGAAQRVLGVLLAWLQERPDGIFIVATSNDVTALPPEVTRRGRFDEIFFVDLPTAPQRAEILARLIATRNRDPRAFDLRNLAMRSDGFSGAELDSAVTSALYAAYAAGADISTQAIAEELATTVPLSRMRAEDIAALRSWAATRARPA